MRSLTYLLSLFLVGIMMSCSSDQAEPINLNKDMCDYCRMNISDGRFGAEVMTEKGRYYKFDDIKCLVHYAEEKPNGPLKFFFIHDFTKNNKLIDAPTAHFVWSKEFKSPMRGNIAAFADKAEADAVAKEQGSQVENWDAAKKRILE